MQATYTTTHTNWCIEHLHTPLHILSSQLWFHPLLLWAALSTVIRWYTPCLCGVPLASCPRASLDAAVHVQNLMNIHTRAAQSAGALMPVGLPLVNGGWKPMDNGFPLHSWARCSETHVICLLQRSQQGQASTAYGDDQVNNTWPNNPHPHCPHLLPGITPQINSLHTSLCLSWAFRRTQAKNQQLLSSWHRGIYIRAGVSTFFSIRCQIKNTLDFVAYKVSIATSQFCCCSVKGALNNPEMNEPGCVPIKPSL